MKKLFANKILTSNTAYFFYFLFGITLLNLIIKFAFLSQQSLYTDEPYSIFYAQQSLKAIYNQCLHDSNPPLYLFILHFWITLFGISSIAVKSLSVIASVGTAILIVCFAKKYLNPVSIVLASLFFIFSNIQLFYSHEARTYAVLGFFVILSFYMYLRVLTKPSVWSLLLLGVINVAVLFFHYTVIYMHIVQFIGALLYYKNYKKGFWFYIISQFISILFFLPWIPTVLSNTPTGKGWIQPPTIGELRYVLFTLANSKINFIIIFIFCIGFISILFTKMKKIISPNFDYKIFIILLLWYILPIIGNFTVSQFFPSFLIRTLLFSSIGLFLLLAYMISSLTIHRYILISIGILLLFVCIKQFHIKQSAPENWNKIVPKIKELKTNKTIVIVTPWWNFLPFSYYYNQKFFEDHNNTLSLLTKEHICFVNESANLKTINFDKFEKVILLKCHPQINNIDSMLLSIGLHKEQTIGITDLRVNVYIK